MTLSLELAAKTTNMYYKSGGNPRYFITRNDYIGIIAKDIFLFVITATEDRFKLKCMFVYYSRTHELSTKSSLLCCQEKKS
jgi:hypothetical protein